MDNSELINEITKYLYYVNNSNLNDLNDYSLIRLIDDGTYLISALTDYQEQNYEEADDLDYLYDSLTEAYKKVYNILDYRSEVRLNQEFDFEIDADVDSAGQNFV